MIPYIFLVLALIWSGFLEVNQACINKELKNRKKINLKQWYSFFPVMLVLLLGIFRETTVGYDSQSYYVYYWSRVDAYSWTELFSNFSIDNGFFIIFKVFDLFIEDWWLARAVLFVLSFCLYYFIIKSETPYPSISLLIFIGLANLGLLFGIFRQALAGGVCMLAYKQIRKGCWFKCLIWIFIAITIHKTSILCISLLLIHFLRVKKFSGLKLIVFSILSYVAFLAIIPQITLLYAEARYYNLARHQGGYGMLIFMIVILALLLHLMRVTGSNKDEDLRYIFNLSCGALFVQIGALQWSLLNRATSFFSIYWCILFPKLICRLPREKRLQYYLIVVVLFGFMFFYQLSDVELFVLHEFKN